jgi:hypothetical protein
MGTHIERHHWANTITGVLDSAFHLTDEEQYFTYDIVNKLLDWLDIPDRGDPAEIPAALALEVSSGLYTVQLTSHQDSNLVRPIRAIVAADIVVSVETWGSALSSLVTIAYPDLDPAERIGLAKVFNDLLVGLGVPNRAASFFPDDVVRAYRDNSG